MISGAVLNRNFTFVPLTNCVDSSVVVISKVVEIAYNFRPNVVEVAAEAPVVVVFFIIFIFTFKFLKLPSQTHSRSILKALYYNDFSFFLFIVVSIVVVVPCSKMPIIECFQVQNNIVLPVVSEKIASPDLVLRRLLHWRTHHFLRVSVNAFLAKIKLAGFTTFDPFPYFAAIRTTYTGLRVGPFRDKLQRVSLTTPYLLVMRTSASHANREVS